MKKLYFYIFFPLLISLLIYLLFRSENIVVNQIINQFFNIKRPHFSFIISDFLIYNLPQGLWVFSTTLASKRLYLGKFNLAILPLFFSCYIELIQFLNLTAGTFDFMDLITAFIGFSIAYYIIESPYKNQQLLYRFNRRTLLFGFSYLIVFLSVNNTHHYFFK